MQAVGEHEMSSTPAPQVSIVMPCHNGQRTLEQAVDSVLRQTFPDWELLIVDDGSTDGSRAIVEKLAATDPRIRVFRNPAPSGVATARNRALQEIRGRYIAFLDCDDAWLPHKLDIQIRAMQTHNAALACGAYDVMNASGALIGRVEPRPGILTYRSLLRNNSVGCLTAMIDRSLCGEVRFHPGLPKGEDYQVWLSLLKRGLTGVCLRERLAVYRVHGTTLSSNKFSAARHRWRVYREFEGKNILASTGYFLMYALTGTLKMLFMHRLRLFRSSNPTHSR